MKEFRKRVPYLLCALLAAAFVGACCRFRPYPFATTDDNWMYFLPLIKAHTDAALHGSFLKMLWGVGAGWSPWENAQAGVLYAPYHLANLLARAIGRPLALLEVSAALHLAAAAMVTYGFAPEGRGRTERLGWAMVAMLMPGPLLIGLNWHNYLACYPWFLALAFLLQRAVRNPGSRTSLRERFLFGGASLGFLLSAHIQMYVLGVGLLVLWAWCERPSREALRALLPFLAAQAPAFVPILFLKFLAVYGTQDWMGERTDPFYLLRHAQTLGTVLHGTVLGNLLYTRDFVLWGDIDWRGVGLFFSPCLVLLPSEWWKRREWAPAAFFLACLIFLGVASAPGLRYLAIGPLEGFRWTWKLAIFTSPLALVSLRARLKPRAVLAWAAAGLSLVVCLRGLSFEIWQSLDAAHPVGAAGLVAETRNLAARAGLPPGSRIAVLGPLDMVEPLPLPVLGLVGDAPLLSGLGTAHIYEPMEPDWVSQGHFGLSLPWRTFLPSDTFFAQPARTEHALASIGVNAAVTVDPRAAGRPGAVSWRDPLGRTAWVIPIPGAPAGPYPGSGGPLTIRTDGTLRAPASPQPPSLLSPRPVTWRRTASGAWEGTPAGPAAGWFVATLLLGLATVPLLAWKGWNTVYEGTPRPDPPRQSE